VIKKSWRFKFDDVRQRFRLTATEKWVALFVLAAFVLGLITKCYRDSHRSPVPSQSAATPKVFVSSRADKAGEPPRKRVRKSKQAAVSSEPALEHEYDQE
jgi:hypothetical protein